MKQYFDIKEIVCDHVYDRFGETAWRFFDPRLLKVMAWLRLKLNRRIIINSRSYGLTQRGLRCNLCSLVAKKTTPYLSAHILGAAFDFDVEGMLAEETRQWIEKNKADLPHPVRLEKGTTWVHLDTATEQTDKVTYFEG